MAQGRLHHDVHLHAVSFSGRVYEVHRSGNHAKVHLLSGWLRRGSRVSGFFFHFGVKIIGCTESVQDSSRQL